MRDALAISALVALAIVLSIKPGTSFTDGLTGYHLHPVAYLHELWQAWTDRAYLGIDTGIMQLALFPGALFYAGLHVLGLSPAMSQRIFFFLEFLICGASAGWFAAIIGPRLTAIVPVPAVASLFYVMNMYVAYTVVGDAATLWPYAMLPVILGFGFLGIRKREPLRFAIVTSIASVIMAGSNPTLVIINLCVVLIFLLYVYVTDPDHKTAFRAIVRYVGLSLLFALLCNAFWIVPFLEYARSAWLPGVFSEGLAWHSSLANILDILRLLGGEGFFGSDPAYGWFYAYQGSYRGVALGALASRLIPLVALSTLLWRQAWREKFLRFLLGLIFFTVVMASAAHPGAWTASIYTYLADHFTAFQIFREVEKWDSVLAFCFALLMAYQAGLLGEFVARLQPKARWFPHFVISSLGVAVFIPVIISGPFPPKSMIRKLPDYWLTASKRLGLSPDQRSLLLPKEYLPHYFWGEVAPDFDANAFQRPVVVSIANSSGAPTPGVAYSIEAAYRGISKGENWSVPLLERLGVSDVIEQRDAFYVASQSQLAPKDQIAALSSLRGVSPGNTSGDLTAFHVNGAISIAAVARPFITPFSGKSLLALFPLLRRSEVAVGVADDSKSIAALPGIYRTGKLRSLAAEITKPLTKFAMVTRKASFTIPADENVRIFARTIDAPDVGTGSGVRIDGELGAAGPITSSWRQIGAFRAPKGRHSIRIYGAPHAIAVSVKVVDANSFESVLDRLSGTANLAKLISVGARTTRFRVPKRQDYILRARLWPTVASSYSVAMQFSKNYHQDSAGESCESVPMSITTAALALASAPPREWYYNNKYIPFTLNGRILSNWYGSTLPLEIYNPFGGVEKVTIRAILAGLGGNRNIEMVGPNGAVSSSIASLMVPKEKQLREIPQRSLLYPNYLSLLGNPKKVKFRVTIPANAWSRIRINASAYNGLPNVAVPMGGFITFGSIGQISAVACGNTTGQRIGAAQLRADSNDVSVRQGRGRDHISVIEASLPPISLARIPFFTVHVDASGPVAISGIVHFISPKGRHGSYTVHLAPSSKRRYGSSLIPESSHVSLKSRLTRLDLVVNLTSVRSAALAYPHVILARVPVTDVGNVAVSHMGADGGDYRLNIGRVAPKALARLVLDIYNPNPEMRDLRIEPEHGLYAGRSIELGPPTISRDGSDYNKWTFPMPVSLPKSEREGWRRQVQVLEQKHVLSPSLSPSLQPHEYYISKSTITALMPINETGISRTWYLVYIPKSWFNVGASGTGTSQISIPLADGFTSPSGTRVPVPRTIKVASVSPWGSPNGYEAPLSLDDAFVETVPHLDRAAKPVLMIDRRQIALTRSPYGWWRAHIRLDAGFHRLRSGTGVKVRALLMPRDLVHASRGRSKIRVGPSFGSVFATVGPGTTRGARALVFREAFNPGWIATNGNRTLPHVMADGYANAFIFSDRPANIRVLFWPKYVLTASRLISAIAVCALLLLILLMKSHLAKSKVGKKAVRENHE